MGVQDTLSELMVHVKETARNDKLDIRKLALVRKANLRLQGLNRGIFHKSRTRNDVECYFRRGWQMAAVLDPLSRILDFPKTSRNRRN